jgi:hypothetical protein
MTYFAEKAEERAGEMGDRGLIRRTMAAENSAGWIAGRAGDGAGMRLDRLG